LDTLEGSKAGIPPGLALVLHVDATAVQPYADTSRVGQRKGAMAEALAPLMLRAHTLGVQVESRHIPGIHNTLADQLSRQHPSPGDYRLIGPPSLALNALLKRLHIELHLDAFAARHNARCSRFWGWSEWEPGSVGADALSQPLSRLQGKWLYANPPWSLIRVWLLRWWEQLHSMGLGTPGLVLVVPWWPAATKWWPMVGQLLRAWPGARVQELKTTWGCFWHPMRGAMPRPRWNLCLLFLPPLSPSKLPIHDLPLHKM